MSLTPEARQDLVRRMRRIEGQTQGIQRMLEEGRDCREVLNQLASVRAATQSVSIILAKYYALSFLSESASRLALESSGGSAAGQGAGARTDTSPLDAEAVVEFLLHLPS